MFPEDNRGVVVTLCQWCRTEPARRRYCSTRCRVAAFRERNRNQDPETLRARERNASSSRNGGRVAALYVRADGHYADVPGVEPWDVQRDASRYEGPHPVVAHPPCAPWGRYRAISGTRQRADLAVRAVGQVRQWGGVLEHPAHSHLWVARELPEPGGERDRWGGWTLLIRQSWWGHRAPKPTWLYIVGTAAVPDMPPPVPDPGGRIETMSRRQRELTPPALARWLIELARRCEPPGFRREGYAAIVPAGQGDLFPVSS